VKELSLRGAAVWHDGDQDLRDGMVRQRITAALFQSRFVILAIDDCFRDSPWCRAEYLPALTVEKQTAATRVIVARMNAATHVPDLLASVPIFDCSRQDSFDLLSAEIQKGNRVPLDIAPRAPSSPNVETLKQTALAVIKEAEDKHDPNSQILRMVAHALADGDSLVHPLHLMATRNMLIKKLNFSSLFDRDRAFLVSAALFFCTLSNSDDRANGLYTLLHLAEHDPMQSLQEEVLRIFLKESDDTLLQIGFPWFERRWGMLSVEQRSMVEICALRDPTHLSLYYPRSQMVDRFSAATRVKIFNRGLDTEMLSIEEKMYLLEERTEYLLSSPDLITGTSGWDTMRKRMGISDMEILFRDLDRLLFESGRVPKGEAAVLGDRVVALVQSIVSHAAHHDGIPLIALEEWVLDFVLKPLLWCTTISTTKSSAQEVFSGICDLLEAKGSLAHEVPVYREYLAIALTGVKMGEMLESECFEETGIRLMQASLKQG
jgi:hypothetical protein